VTGYGDPGLADPDAYIRTQLARAAETHASHIDISARLKAALEAGRNDDHDGAAAADS
jgi:hypothetical protein